VVCGQVGLSTGLQITVGHRTMSDVNLANVRAKVILIGHWSDHKINCHLIHFFAVTKSDCKFTQFAFCNKIYEAF
jgi:hypothetical protein